MLKAADDDEVGSGAVSALGVFEPGRLVVWPRSEFCLLKFGLEMLLKGFGGCCEGGNWLACGPWLNMPGLKTEVTKNKNSHLVFKIQTKKCLPLHTTIRG